MRIKSVPDGLRDSLLMTGGNTVATAMSAVAVMLLSRLLGPVGFGEFSVGFSLMFMLAKINDLGLLAAQLKYVPLSEEREDKNALFSYAIKVKLILGFWILLAGWLVAPVLITILKFSNPAIIYLSFLVSPVSVLYEQLAAMLQSLQRIKQSVVATFIQAGTKLVLTLFLFLKGVVSPAVSLVAYMMAPLSALLAMKRLLPSWFGLNMTASYDRQRRLIWKMAGHSLVYYISLGLVDNLDVMFVQGLLTPVDTGLYGGVSRIAMLFVMMSYSLAAVLNPRVAKYTSRAHLGKYMKKAGLMTMGLIASLMILLPLSKLMIWVTVGPQYLLAVKSLQVLLITAMVTIATTLFTAPFFGFKKAEWYFSAFGVLQLVVLVGGNLWLIPRFGLDGAAWARLMAKSVVFSFTLVTGWVYYRKLKV